MTTYISLLRGINVSGQKLIKMDALKVLCENLGFTDVRTYLQSGNVIFQTHDSQIAVLEKLISDQVKKQFGFDVPVIVLTVDDLMEIVEKNPFKDDPSKDPASQYVTFLSAQPVKYDIQSIGYKKTKEEEITVTERAVYLYCPNGYGRTKLTNNFLESKLNVTATTRNWKSTTELLTIGQKR
ncbi:MAG: DUF1697 domain-containing protein [Bacteroidales bacterium]|nr:DUF1697 domain-containing protein [Bacteroidales bacterium]